METLHQTEIVVIEIGLPMEEDWGHTSCGPSLAEKKWALAVMRRRGLRLATSSEVAAGGYYPYPADAAGFRYPSRGMARLLCVPI